MSDSTEAEAGGVEVISEDGQILAYVIRTSASAEATRFFTPSDSAFQGGFVVYGKGRQVPAHTHLPIERRIVGTSELLIVHSGHCVVDIYTAARRLVASRELLRGDAVLTIGGGHGFRMIENTTLLEIKQGPYMGVEEKERFAAQPLADDPG